MRAIPFDLAESEFEPGVAVVVERDGLFDEPDGLLECRMEPLRVVQMLRDHVPRRPEVRRIEHAGRIQQHTMHCRKARDSILHFGAVKPRQRLVDELPRPRERLCHVVHVASIPESHEDKARWAMTAVGFDDSTADRAMQAVASAHGEAGLHALWSWAMHEESALLRERRYEDPRCQALEMLTSLMSLAWRELSVPGEERG